LSSDPLPVWTCTIGRHERYIQSRQTAKNDNWGVGKTRISQKKRKTDGFHPGMSVKRVSNVLTRGRGTQKKLWPLDGTICTNSNLRASDIAET
jgi:hypothetical protein